MGRTRRPRLKKRLGQHHLVRSEICAPLLEYLRPEGKHVVEIGPGGGVLTRLLVACAESVDAIEMDAEWAFALRAAEPSTALRIVIGDALDIEWSRLPCGALVTGNLPYQISTAVVERLLPLAGVVDRAAFLVQREVAERLIARPGSSAYGSLSILVDVCSRRTRLGRVARGSFRPPPKVEGEFIGLDLVSPPFPVDDFSRFSATVRQAFALRRKTLRNSLAAGWGGEAAARAVAALGLPLNARAEELDSDMFLRLHRHREGG